MSLMNFILRPAIARIYSIRDQNEEDWIWTDWVSIKKLQFLDWIRTI